MKTKELIKQLQLEDPTGEAEVSVGNVDIHFVGSEPAFYDGPLQVLQRNEKTAGYNITGGKYKRTGVKIVIYPLSFSDAILDNADLPIDYSELNEQQAAATKKAHDDLRQWCRKLDHKFLWEDFLKWVTEQVKDNVDSEDIKNTALYFFEKEVLTTNPEQRSKINWPEKYEVGFYEGFFEIRKK